MNPFRKKAVMPDPSDVLPGRATPLRVNERHAINGNRIVAPFPGIWVIDQLLVALHLA